MSIDTYEVLDPDGKYRRLRVDSSVPVQRFRRGRWEVTIEVGFGIAPDGLLVDRVTWNEAPRKTPRMSQRQCHRRTVHL